MTNREKAELLASTFVHALNPVARARLADDTEQLLSQSESAALDQALDTLRAMHTEPDWSGGWGWLAVVEAIARIEKLKPTKGMP